MITKSKLVSIKRTMTRTRSEWFFLGLSYILVYMTFSAIIVRIGLGDFFYFVVPASCLQFFIGHTVGANSIIKDINRQLDGYEITYKD